MKTIPFLVALIAFTASVVYADALQEEANKLFKPIPTKVREFKHNPTNKDKLLLGKMLYFEPRLSTSQFISCNSCHNVGMGFADGLSTSVGHAWQIGTLNAPTVLNSVYSVAQFWDGRSPNLMEQAKLPIQESDEMNATPEYVIAVLSSIPEYVELFKKAFPNEEDDLVTFNNVARALEVFEATLITPNAKFDKYLKGEVNALNASEKAGLKSFIEVGCASCHNGMNIGGHGFSDIERYVKSVKAGKPDNRYRFAKNKFNRDDEKLIKVPSLRNIDLTAPYFQDGKEWSLKKALSHMSELMLARKFSDKEVEDVYNFLLATNGDIPKIEYPILPKSRENTPKPFLDNGTRPPVN